MNAIFSAACATLMLFACASLALPRARPTRTGAVATGPSEEGWRLVTGVLVVMLVVLNANLWVPAQGIFVSLAMLSVLTMLRATALPAVRGAFLAPTLIACAVVSAAALLVFARVGASSFWLLEGPNHDSLFYFQGVVWAWRNAVHVDPVAVAEAWQLGNCNQGAVYIGNDCIGYRSGTYSMLAVANGIGRASSGNAVQVLAAMAALFPVLALLPVLPQGESSSARKSTIVVGSSLAVLAGLVFLAPGMTSALGNANLATAFGSACVAMTLGLAIVPCASPILRAFALGLATAIAGHLYGEAAILAGYLAAFGVIGDSVRLRRLGHFFLGGSVALSTFGVGLNVVGLELLESFTAINAIAQGGQWSGWYLSAPTWTWFSSPFSSVLLGVEPAVSKSLLVSGTALSFLVVAFGLVIRQTRLATIALAALAVVLVGYVEFRAYAYGEHKILQLLGPAAYMLAALIVVELIKTSHPSKYRVAARVAAAVILVLMLLCAGLFARRVALQLRDSIPLHGLAPDFARGLDPIGRADQVVIDDLGAVSVEKFQKTHYLGFLLQMRGATTLLPLIGDDALRGGYLRHVRADTMRTVSAPRWAIRLKSDAGARSVFDYPASVVKATSEYDLVDLSGAAGVLAAGDGWYGCEAAHCWTRPTFEIESVVARKCSEARTPRLALELSFFAPPQDATFTVRRSDGWTAMYRATDGIATIELPTGWARTTFQANWSAQSPQRLQMSQDSRVLFAMVRRATVECVRDIDAGTHARTGELHD